MPGNLLRHGGCKSPILEGCHHSNEGLHHPFRVVESSCELESLFKVHSSLVNPPLKYLHDPQPVIGSELALVVFGSARRAKQFVKLALNLRKSPQRMVRAGNTLNREQSKVDVFIILCQAASSLICFEGIAVLHEVGVDVSNVVCGLRLVVSLALLCPKRLRLGEVAESLTKVPTIRLDGPKLCGR